LETKYNFTKFLARTKEKNAGIGEGGRGCERNENEHQRPGRARTRERKLGVKATKTPPLFRER